jgi:hypothetical protein
MFIQYWANNKKHLINQKLMLNIYLISTILENKYL